MKEITKDICIATRKTLQASIGESIEVNGMPLGVTVGKITYSDDEMTVKVIIRAAHYQPDEVKQLNRMLETYNLDPKKKDKNGCVLYGFNPRRKKMPWVLVNDDGNKWNCSDQYAFHHFWDLDAYNLDDRDSRIQYESHRFCFLGRQSMNDAWDKTDRDMRDLEDKLAKIGGAPAGKKKAKKKSKKKAARKSK